MANLKKEYVIRDMKLKNKNILNMLPKAVTNYIKYKYQCSTYLAKQISKELTNDGTRTS
jgi:lipopolysaccharide biosynthesis glycosyltransferase